MVNLILKFNIIHCFLLPLQVNSAKPNNVSNRLYLYIVLGPFIFMERQRLFSKMLTLSCNERFRPFQNLSECRKKFHKCEMKIVRCNYYTAQNIKFSMKDFLSTCDPIRSFLRIWSHLMNKSLMENFIFCSVLGMKY